MIAVVWFGRTAVIPMALPVVATLLTLWLTSKREETRRAQDLAHTDAQRLADRFTEERRRSYLDVVLAIRELELAFQEQVLALVTDRPHEEQDAAVERRREELRTAVAAVDLHAPLNVRTAAYAVLVSVSTYRSEVREYEEAAKDQVWPRPALSSGGPLRESKDSFLAAARADLEIPSLRG